MAQAHIQGGYTLGGGFDDWEPNTLTANMVALVEWFFGIRMSVERVPHQIETRFWHFMFLNWPTDNNHPDPGIETRFNQMGALIRERIRVENMTHPILRIHLDFQELVHPIQFAGWRPDRISGGWLLRLFRKLCDDYPEAQMIGLEFSVYDATAGFRYRMNEYNVPADDYPTNEELAEMLQYDNQLQELMAGAHNVSPDPPRPLTWGKGGLWRHRDERVAARDLQDAELALLNHWAKESFVWTNAVLKKGGHCALRAFVRQHRVQVMQEPKRYQWNKDHPMLTTGRANPDESYMHLVADSYDLAVRLDMETAQSWTIRDLQKIVDDAAYENCRIVVLAVVGKVVRVMGSVHGERWVRPNILPDFHDNHSIYLLLHDEHYTAIDNIAAFLTHIHSDRAQPKTAGVQRRRVTCRMCFQRVWPPAQLREGEAPHTCWESSRLFPCDKCGQNFQSADGLECHESEGAGMDFAPCEVCGKGEFNGPYCHLYHITRTCKPRSRDQQKEICADCEYPYIVGARHRCVAKGCVHCGKQYADPGERHTHACCLPRNTRKWNPVRKREAADTGGKRGGGAKPKEAPVKLIGPDNVERHFTLELDNKMDFEPHVGYDFETNRARKLAGRGDKWELAVMGWTMRLMIPCVETGQYINSMDVVEHVETAVRRRRWVIPVTHIDGIWSSRRVRKQGAPALTDVPETIAVHGHSIKSFAWAASMLWSESQYIELGEQKVAEHHWKPTFWAHNGSKFDAKFIFDYFVREEGREVRPSGDALPPTLAPFKGKKGGKPQYRKQQFNRSDPNAVSLTNMGSRILSMAIGAMTFKCSAAHAAVTLSELPDLFGLLSTAARKGEFPYGKLLPENLTCNNGVGLVHERGLFPLWEYDPKSKRGDRRTKTIQWWIDEQRRFNVPYEEVKAILQDTRSQIWPHELYFAEGVWDAEAAKKATFVVAPYSILPGVEPTPWSFKQEFWAYLDADVDVLCEAWEAYHQLASTIHTVMFEKHGVGPGDDGEPPRIVSPLQKSTLPGWAYDMYTTWDWFMPDDTIMLLRPPQHGYVRASLKGGRTDMRCTYMETTPAAYLAGHRLDCADVTSLYPSVMKCGVHGTYYPVGKPWWIQNDPRGLDTWYMGPMNNEDLIDHMDRQLDATGFLQVSVKRQTSVTHPTLSHKGKKRQPLPDEEMAEAFEGEGKLLFANEDVDMETYAWPELRDALLHGEVEIVEVHNGLLFKKGTDVFEGYINTFFDLKRQATIDENEGLRNLAKLLLNSLWGKLGQRAYPVFEFVENYARFCELATMFDLGKLKPLMVAKWVDHRVLLQYQDPISLNNVRTTAPQLAACVSMWGRVVLKKKLRELGQRALYYDTDSVVGYRRPCDAPLVDEVDDIGNWANDLIKPFKKAGHKVSTDTHDISIRQFVSLAPKTYAYLMQARPYDPNQPSVWCTKVVCKGFEPSWANSLTINFHNFKALQWHKNKLHRVVHLLREKGGVLPDEDDDASDFATEIVYMEDKVGEWEQRYGRMWDREYEIHRPIPMSLPEDDRETFKSSLQGWSDDAKITAWQQKCAELGYRRTTYLTIRERAARKLTEVVDAGRLQFTSSLMASVAKPVERFNQKIMKGAYTKGQVHPKNPLLVIPYGSTCQADLPNEGRTFLDDTPDGRSFIYNTEHYV